MTIVHEPSKGETMDKLRPSFSVTLDRNTPAKHFRRKRFALPLLVLLTLTAVAIDILSGPQINFGAGYFLVVAIAAYVLGPVWAVVAAIAMLATQWMVYALLIQAAQTASVLSSQLTLTTLLNNAIIYVITIALFVVVYDVAHLREENLRLRTLRQTMVTVNDIVFNRLQYFTVLLDLAEAGVTPTPHQIEVGRSALLDVTQKLRQLSALTQVSSYLAAGDIEAVFLDDEPQESSM
jgi:hypothetical protein